MVVEQEREVDSLDFLRRRKRRDVTAENSLAACAFGDAFFLFFFDSTCSSSFFFSFSFLSKKFSRSSWCGWQPRPTRACGVACSANRVFVVSGALPHLTR